MLDYTNIKSYWDNRAKKEGSTLQSTTNDYYLREIEINTLSHYISELINDTQKELHIGDIGCGDGYVTSSLASNFKQAKFFGYDYSPEMIKNADTRKSHNCVFNLADILHDDLRQKFDVLYTTRCLINLPDQELQKKALLKIHESLNENGLYVMIENFMDGHINFNEIRASFGLESIPVRDHNLFFSHDWLDDFMKDKFDIIKIENISSMYYLVSRIVYSKICQENGAPPDYFDIHHNLASKLPFSGNFGPVKLLLLKKIQNTKDI